MPAKMAMQPLKLWRFLRCSASLMHLDMTLARWRSLAALRIELATQFERLLKRVMNLSTLGDLCLVLGLLQD